MTEFPRKVLLPSFTLMEECNANDSCAIKRSISRWKGREPFTYFERQAIDPTYQTTFNYNLFPVVLDQNSVPWDLGTLYILSRLESATDPVMATFHSLAQDLGAFKEWINEHDNPNQLLFDFPKIRGRRVTYRYRGALKLKIGAEEIAQSTAKRRMGTVVSFYRWLIDEITADLRRIDRSN